MVNLLVAKLRQDTEKKQTQPRLTTRSLQSIQDVLSADLLRLQTMDEQLKRGLSTLQHVVGSPRSNSTFFGLTNVRHRRQNFRVAKGSPSSEQNLTSSKLVEIPLYKVSTSVDQLTASQEEGADWGIQIAEDPVTNRSQSQVVGGPKLCDDFLLIGVGVLCTLVFLSLKQLLAEYRTRSRVSAAREAAKQQAITKYFSEFHCTSNQLLYQRQRAKNTTSRASLEYGPSNSNMSYEPDYCYRNSEFLTCQNLINELDRPGSDSISNTLFEKSDLSLDDAQSLMSRHYTSTTTSHLRHHHSENFDTNYNEKYEDLLISFNEESRLSEEVAEHVNMKDDEHLLTNSTVAPFDSFSNYSTELQVNEQTREHTLPPDSDASSDIAELNTARLEFNMPLDDHMMDGTVI